MNRGDSQSGRGSVRGRVVELQSLRGVAASAVLVHHVSYYYGIPHQWRIAIDGVLNAHAAIVLFFVLSGYVLALSLLREPLDRHSVAQFYARRVTRILPALLVATSLMLAYIVAFGSYLPSGASEWAHRSIASLTISPFRVVASLVGWPYILPPAYTIFIEAVGSAILPFLLLTLRWNAASAALTMLGLGAVALLSGNLRGSLVWSMFLLDFALGVAIALLPLQRLRWPVALGIVSAVGLVLFRAVWMMVSTGGLRPLEVDYHNAVSSFAEGLCAAGLVVSIVAAPQFFSMLRGKLANWLGDISYGIYLVHFPVMAVGGQIIAALPIAASYRIAALLAFTVAGTLIGASLLFRYVESPGIRYGKTLSQRLARAP
jgi:peptidoglycan/LPS O-acetylase OafA/YrhL